MPTEDGTFRTDDLGLAVTLSLSGFKYQLEKFSEQRVLWVFSYVDEREEEFQDVVDDYHSFEAAVEPRRFMGRWKDMRNEFFALIPPRPRIRPPAVPAS